MVVWRLASANRNICVPVRSRAPLRTVFFARTMATTSTSDPKSTPGTSFTLSSKPTTVPSPRLGKLTLPSRSPISTPNYVALSSRGTVPHLTPDVVQSETSIPAVYTGFEDYAESIPLSPTFFSLSSDSNTSSALRRFIALHPSTLLIMGPRRHPCIACPSANKYTSLNVCTSVGFRQMEVPLYIEAVEKCGADIAIGAVDVDLGTREGQSEAKKVGVKRRDHMVERSGAWMRALLTAWDSTNGTKRSEIWAPMLPLDAEVQRSYLEVLEESTNEGKFGGVVLYENRSVDVIPGNMTGLPRMTITEPKTPAEVLDAVELGIDLVTMPFITKASEAGVAFSFTFTSRSFASASNTTPDIATGQRRALGIDMWSTLYARDTSPLVHSCRCYTCTKHSRAYIHHLLQAKEMLAWVLLQIHNHHVSDLFFASIRESIAAGTLEKDIEQWKRRYESEWPEFVGQGPRIRGYQSSSAGITPAKKNKTAYTKLGKKEGIPYRQNDRKEKLAEEVGQGSPSPAAESVDFEEVGFAEVFNLDKTDAR